MFAPILNNLAVIATFGSTRCWSGRATSVGHHSSREDRPRGRDHVRRRRDDAGAVAVAAAPRVPLASAVRLEPRGGAPAGQARAVGRRLRRGEPGRLHRDHRVHGQFEPGGYPPTRARSSSSSSRTRSSPCRSSPRSCRRCPERWAADDLDGLRTLFSRACATPSSSSCRRRSATSRSRIPIVGLLLQHGAPTRTTTELIARTLQAFAVGLPFFSAFQLLTRTFYAMQDTRTPALVNVAAAVVNIAANLLAVLRLARGARARARPRDVLRVRARSSAWCCSGGGWAGSTARGSRATLARRDPRRRCWPRARRSWRRVRSRRSEAAPGRSAAWCRSSAGVVGGRACVRRRRRLSSGSTRPMK